LTSVREETPGVLRFDGKTALVTGAGGGIGRAHALLLAARGASVVVNGNFRSSGTRREDEVVEAIRQVGGKATAANGSVANPDHVRRMVDTAVQEFGGLDIVINNAGTGEIDARVQDAPEETLERQLEVHLRGCLLVSAAAWGHLARSGHGRILNTGSSVAFGFAGPHGWDGAYSPAKSSLFAITRQMAGAGAEAGIAANMILPWAASPMAADTLKGTELGEWWLRTLDPHKVAAGSLYLLHQDCPATGQFFSVGGGRVARIVWAEPKGLWSSVLEPESVRDRWREVWGSVDEDGVVSDMHEIKGQATELAMMRKLLP